MLRIRQSASGFTLIEVLIGMTLLSVMVCLLFAGLRIAAESWHAGERKIAEVNQKAVAYQFFKHHLTAVQPLAMPGDESGKPVFQGDRRQLRFLAAMPASAARTGLQIFDVYRPPGHPEQVLVGLTPYWNEPDSVRAEQPEILLDGVADLNFAYFGQTDEKEPGQWHDEWHAVDRLPALVKISVILADGSFWPDMVIAVKTAQAGSHSKGDTETNVMRMPNQQGMDDASD